MSKVDEFKYEIVRKHMFGKWAMFSNGEDLIYSLDDIAEVEAILYPKDLYKQNSQMSDVVIYSFEKAKIRIITLDEDGTVTVLSRLFGSIQSIELKHKNRGSSRLIINFSETDKIDLDSQLDSDHKQWAYQEIIMKLYKELKW
ncbi:hypothetical protein [Planococcus citreus]|uniref:Uncharacterized protein n=1 Tax=Planococcus citreus TaxID=1373 RepID=A0A497YK16_9BACL|nr:hypothetical protein [Planococcus citreus]RLJ89911.1 hypothetical protein DFR62_0051 [Planococcus citreus]